MKLINIEALKLFLQGKEDVEVFQPSTAGLIKVRIEEHTFHVKGQRKSVLEALGYE